MYYFSINKTGKDHFKNDDSCLVEAIEGTDYIVGIIADGLGSCSHSHIGSREVVKVAFKCIKLITKREFRRYGIIVTFKRAKLLLSQLAKEYGIPMECFETTLTIAVYDKKKHTLVYGHCGDGGIVALNTDGSFQMITKRHKGDTTNSVCPLSSQADWEFGTVEDVESFAMCTDGLLDTFVSQADMPLVNMSFFQFALTSVFDHEIVEKTYNDYLESDKVESGDDLTLVVVNNLTSPIGIDFDLDEYLQRIDEENKMLEEMQADFRFTTIPKEKIPSIKEALKNISKGLKAAAKKIRDGE